MDELKMAITEMAELKNALAWRERELEVELRELGDLHRQRLAVPGGCPCTVPGSGRCVAADAIERGMEKLDGHAMPAVNGSANN